MTDLPQDAQGAPGRIAQAVAAFHEGQARIEREFGAIHQRIEQSLALLHGDAGSPGNGVREATAQLLVADRQQADARQAKRIAAWRLAFGREWARLVAEITRANLKLRQQQPPLAEFSAAHPLPASQLPDRIVLGTQLVGYGDLVCPVLHALPFPLSRALVLSAQDTAQGQSLDQLLLRLLSLLPPGQLELTVIDPLKLGLSVQPFLPLLKVAQLVPQQRVLTRSDEIEAVLGKLTDEVEELIQHGYSDGAADWAAYSAQAGDRSPCYKVVVLFDVPAQLSERSLWFIERLCESGPRCGILPILATDPQRMADRRFEKLGTTIAASASGFDGWWHCAEAAAAGLSFTPQPERWPQKAALDGFLSTLTERYAAKQRYGKPMADLWGDFARNESTSGGFDLPIGWTAGGDAVPLTLGATSSEHHVLLAGKTGSGKSNLLHVLIHTLCEKYSPAEVDLYLLDYKESTEFTIYADPPLPHARLVATESDPEYGITVLRHLVDELEQRARRFKQAGVRDFAEYRHAGGAGLTRILLVIDEFQVLFSDQRQIAEAAEQLLSQLLKQGRSFGIHILLATQTLKGINAQSIGSIITQLGCRIALACGQEDSAMILGTGNWAAADLRSPPEGIINNANGARSGNVKLLIPLADSALCRDHLARLAAKAAALGMGGKTRIFSGASLPRLPSPADYPASGEQAALLLGQRLSFDADTLSVPLTRRSGFNVIFSGYDDQIHDGLLAATLSSIAAGGQFDEVVYFNGRGVTPGGGFAAAATALGARLRMVDAVEDLPLQAMADAIGTHRVALIIDGLDAEKALHPAAAFRVAKPGEPPSAADLLRRLAEEGPRKGTFVFAFVDRWQRCAMACKDMFSLFELRIAYCMGEDEAGSLVSGGIGKFKGIEKPTRAVYVNRMTNDIAWFRPYIYTAVS